MDNPYFPLKPGRVFVYTGTKDGKRAWTSLSPLGVRRSWTAFMTRVVEDRLYLAGVLDERTSDYYAQDACGNVWYFGEDTAELDRHGRVTSTEGSFHAGVDGAQPGVFMQAHPSWAAGSARSGPPARPRTSSGPSAGRPACRCRRAPFHHALRTEETTAWSPESLTTSTSSAASERSRRSRSRAARRCSSVEIIT